ncbi:hypothetical protein AB9F45_26115 [Rhizobium leguminosarum]|uniref:hypothetical protein n=1 Tax=Rhizobium leguminosarum TaxID=384 RepID=UPI003F9EA5AE
MPSEIIPIENLPPDEATHHGYPELLAVYDQLLPANRPIPYFSDDEFVELVNHLRGNLLQSEIPFFDEEIGRIEDTDDLRQAPNLVRLINRILISRHRPDLKTWQ